MAFRLSYAWPYNAAIPAGGKPTAPPLKYAFPSDATTIEELDTAAASSLLLTGESA
jgi:hypothetical protein